jgi:hypothetical protein
MKCCANTYLNRQYLIKKLIPKYPNVKIQYPSLATNINQKKIQSDLKTKSNSYIRKNTTIKRGADKSLARQGRGKTTATVDFYVDISYL